MTTTVSPWAIGNKFTAAKMNVETTAITEQQTVWSSLGTRVTALENATALCYSVTKNTSETSGAWTNYGSWSSNGGYTGNSAGVLTPTAGIYLATVTVTASTGSWTGRTQHRIDVGGVAQGISSTPDGTGEDTASVSCVTWRVPINTVIEPIYLHASGASRLVQVRFTIVRLST